MIGIVAPGEAFVIRDDSGTGTVGRFNTDGCCGSVLDWLILVAVVFTVPGLVVVITVVVLVVGCCCIGVKDAILVAVVV